jgi:hypothetical protein
MIGWEVIDFPQGKTMISSKLQAIGGSYLLPSILETFCQDLGSLVSAGLFLGTVSFSGLLVPILACRLVSEKTPF